MNPSERIEEFRKMAQANPEDELAHFALGQALLNADRPGEAIGALKYVLRLNEEFSKAWVLLGEAHAGSGDDLKAVEIWQQGYEVALKQGHLMPANEIKAHLEAQGAPIPEVTAGGPVEAVVEDDRPLEEGEIRDHRTGRIGQKMQFNPFADEVGDWIQAHITQDSWQDWMEMSVKVINELRLDLGDPQAQQVYDQYMKDFLAIPENLFEGKVYE
ncbi:MAG: Fe(2+)-trafficking protein [Bradymonadia bacterium]